MKRIIACLLLLSIFSTAGYTQNFSALYTNQTQFYSIDKKIFDSEIKRDEYETELNRKTVYSLDKLYELLGSANFKDYESLRSVSNNILHLAKTARLQDKKFAYIFNDSKRLSMIKKKYPDIEIKIRTADNSESFCMPEYVTIMNYCTSFDEILNNILLSILDNYNEFEESKSISEHLLTIDIFKQKDSKGVPFSYYINNLDPIINSLTIKTTQILSVFE